MSVCLFLRTATTMAKSAWGKMLKEGRQERERDRERGGGGGERGERERERVCEREREGGGGEERVKPPQKSVFFFQNVEDPL